MITDEKYIIVNYHYVHNPDEQNLVKAFPCSVAEFEKQVKYLAENYNIVPVAELYRALEEGREGKFCALTFDDGTKDHYDNALPVLQKYGAVGTFFIITDSFKGKISVAHKVHLLRPKFSYKELTSFYNEFIGDAIPAGSFIDADEKYDDITTSNFKTTITRMAPEKADKFLLDVFAKLGWNEKEKASELFMNQNEVKEMQEAGMAIGSHGASHNSLLVLGGEQIKKEVSDSKKILEELLEQKVDIFSYPHGQYGEGHPGMLEDVGFRYGVTTKRRGLDGDDSALLIPRFDTNDLRDAIL